MQGESSGPAAAYGVTAPRTSRLADVETYVLDSMSHAKVTALTLARYRSWFLNLTIGPFLAIAPFVFLADTLVGRGKPLTGSYFDDLGYADYIGFMVVPLMAVNLSNTVFSWISNLLKGEQRNGTLERLLVSVQFTSTLFVGRALAHLVFMTAFVAVTLVLVFIWVRPDFNVDIPAAGLSVFLHLAAVYGMAFALSSALMRIADAWIIQTVMTRTLIAILAGASFPITLFPGWLQFVAKLFPFTWAFDLERRSLLRGETVMDLAGGLTILAGMTFAMWIVGFYMLRRELTAARRSGVLGGF